MRRTEKGFSLIELSIVLIIIGLLVAGITGGASLVRSSTVRAVMSEANSYNAAVNAYYARFSALPGDDKNGKKPDGSALPGDGNGRIEYINNSLGTTSSFEAATDYEGLNAWKHLVAANIIEGSFTDTTSYIKIPGTHIPASKLSSAGWVMDFKDDMNILSLSAPVGNRAGWKTGVSTVYSSGVISPEAAKSIDVKMDDGSPINGKIRSLRGYTVDNSANCMNGADYADVLTPECYMGFALSL